MNWKSGLLKTTLYFGGAAAAVGVAVWVRFITSIDPFAALRVGEFSRPDEVAITLRDVSTKAYEGSKLVSSSKVDRIEISKDRQLMTCYGVDGEYSSEKRGSFKFHAEQGAWNGMAKVFEATKGARLTNKDLDLTLDRFRYDSNRKMLVVQSPIKGRFGDGNVIASNLTYWLDIDGYSITNPEWTGTLQTNQDEGQKKTRWTIKAKSVERKTAEIETWIQADATDGEIIVKAPTIERNTKSDVLVATGKVQYFSSKENLVCDKCTVFRKEKRAILEGHVQLLIKPEDQEKLEVVDLEPYRPVVPDEIAKSRPPAPQTDEQKKQDDEVRNSKNKRKYPTTVWAERIEYWYAKGSRHALITGSPQAAQDLPGGRWRRVWTTKALYDGEKETLRLESTPGKNDTRIMTSIGDDLTAKWFQVSTKEDDDAWSAEEIAGTVAVDEDELPPKPGGATKPPPSMKGEIKRTSRS